MESGCTTIKKKGNGTEFLLHIWDSADYTITRQQSIDGDWGCTFVLLNYLHHKVGPMKSMKTKVEFMAYIDSF